MFYLHLEFFRFAWFVQRIDDVYVFRVLDQNSFISFLFVLI